MTKAIKNVDSDVVSTEIRKFADLLIRQKANFGGDKPPTIA